MSDLKKTRAAKSAFADPFVNAIKLKDHERRAAARRLTTASMLATTSLSPLRNDLLPRLELVILPISDLRQYERRLRKPDPAHALEIRQSIAMFGFTIPVLIGKGNRVLDGEVSIEAAKLAGLDRVPCIRIDHLSDREQRILRAALKRLPQKAPLDLDALRIEFCELMIEGQSLVIPGFSGDDIDNVLALDPGDGVERGPLSPNAVAVARSGDLFHCGPHVVACGDATDRSVWLRLMNATGVESETGAEARFAALRGDRPLARMVLTDEPYNVAIRGNVTRGGHREFAMGSGEMSEFEYLAFNEAWMSATLSHLVDGGLLATFIDWRGSSTVEAAAVRVGLRLLNQIVWAKTNAGLGSLYRSQYELLPIFKKGAAPHVNNVSLGKRGRWRSNLWTYPGASSLGSDARRGLKDHPTVKPTAMLEDALLDLTNRGELVLDPFLGSGSTLIACQRTGRICRGVEIDPLYVDVVIRRFEAETGETARLAETGESFVELDARRAAEGAAAKDDAPVPDLDAAATVELSDAPAGRSPAWSGEDDAIPADTADHRDPPAAAPTVEDGPKAASDTAPTAQTRRRRRKA